MKLRQHLKHTIEPFYSFFAIGLTTLVSFLPHAALIGMRRSAIGHNQNFVKPYPLVTRIKR